MARHVRAMIVVGGWILTASSTVAEPKTPCPVWVTSHAKDDLGRRFVLALKERIEGSPLYRLASDPPGTIQVVVSTIDPGEQHLGSAISVTFVLAKPRC